MAITCGGVAVAIGAGRGTARVPFQQIHERQDGCDEYALDSAGRPTSRWLAVRWTEQRRVAAGRALHVTRADPARDPR